VFESLDPLQASAGSVTFEPGARTAWHAHPAGQILIVTAGTGRVQRWGDPRLSPAASDAARARAVQDEFGVVAPKSVELTTDVVLNDVWRRSDLSPRDRSLVTIAALAATGDDELEVYLRRGLESGLAPSQMGEAVTHVAFYAGWSKATRAMRAITRVLGK
jgi:4-carboxymuconolactone decarboxylase